MLKEFQDFILKGNAFDLAIAVIIGAAFSSVVTSMVNDIIMPPLGMLMSGQDFSNYFLDLTALKGSVVGDATAKAPATVKEAKDMGHAIISYGVFINTIINLLIVGGVIFLIIKQINRLKRAPAAAGPAATPEDVRLLTEIRDLLKRGAPGATAPAPPATPKTPRR